MEIQNATEIVRDMYYNFKMVDFVDEIDKSDNMIELIFEIPENEIEEVKSHISKNYDVTWAIRRVHHNPRYLELHILVKNDEQYDDGYDIGSSIKIPISSSTKYGNNLMSLARTLEDTMVDIELGNYGDLDSSDVDTLYDAIMILHNLSGNTGGYDRLAASKKIRDYD